MAIKYGLISNINGMRLFGGILFFLFLFLPLFGLGTLSVQLASRIRIAMGISLRRVKHEDLSYTMYRSSGFLCSSHARRGEEENGESGWVSGEYPVTSYAVLQQVFNLVGIPHQIGDKGEFGGWASLPMSSSFLLDRDIGSTSLMVTFLHMDGVNLKGEMVYALGL